MPASPAWRPAKPSRPRRSKPSRAPASPAQRAEAAAQRERRRLLAVQREAVQSCERQFGEAAQACRQVFDLIGSEPQKASAQCQALTQAFLDKMLVGERDLSLRLLGEGAGDKVALHAINVGVISLLMGRVFGMSADDMLDLGVGALLHDVGKAELPERLRFRAEHFTPSEQKYYEEHVGHGIATGRRMGLRPGALLVIGQHHEHADGSGFPLHLGSDRLTFAARIVALANRYDNLCNPPIPAKALTPHEALSLMFAQGKNQFDTAIMGAFIKMMGVYPPGSAVQLTDDRYALVTAVNSTRPLKPRVLVYDPKVPRDEALLIDLQLAPAWASGGCRCGDCGHHCEGIRARQEPMKRFRFDQFGYLRTVNTVRILVAGATGYVGSRLVSALIDEDHDVIAATRNPDRLADFGWHDQVTGVALDAHDEASAKKAFADAGPIDVVYYLVHGIGQPDFRDADNRAADNVAKAAKDAGVRRIVYLGGFVPDVDELSQHLTSRAEVAHALSVDGGPDVVWLGAAMIIGSGSTSFEMLRYVGDRFVLIPMPAWSVNPMDPISIRDVLYYLVAAADGERVPAGAYDILGPETTSYGEPDAGLCANLRQVARGIARAHGGHRRGVVDDGRDAACPWRPGRRSGGVP